jgi:hypothetical protein
MLEQQPRTWRAAVNMLHARWEPRVLREYYHAVATGIWYPTGEGTWQRAETEDLVVRSVLGDAAMGGASLNLEDTPIEKAPPGLWEALFTTDVLELPRIAGDPGHCAGVRALAGYRLTVVGTPPRVS